MTYKAANPPGVTTLQSLSALPPYSRKPGLYGPTMSVCAKAMSIGVHNIAFSLSPDGFWVSDLGNEPKSGLVTSRGLTGPSGGCKGGHERTQGWPKNQKFGEPSCRSPLGGHLRYLLTDVPPQPNSPPDNVFNPDRPAKDLEAKRWDFHPSSASSNK